MSTNLDEKDIEKILAVNAKSVEIQNHVAGQFEEIKKNGTEIVASSKKTEEKISVIEKKIEEISREIFQLKVLFATGMLSLLIQIIQIFIKK